MKTAIIHAQLLTPYRTVPNGGLLIENGIITRIFQGDVPEPVDEIIDAKGNYASPGFIDIHTHGGGGHDFMDGTAEAIIAAAKAHMEHGTTSVLTTTLTSTDEELFELFSNFKAAKRTIQDGPNLLGLHLEGPYFSMEQKGAQDPRFIKTPDPEHYMKFLDASDDIVRVSAAPEIPGALEFGRELSRRGILASIAHSDAVYSQVVEAFENGYTHVTHLYSGMSMLRRINAYRYLGVVESAYMLDEMTVEIIADGKHLPPELLRLIMRSKPIDKICLVTDSMRGAGMPEGSHALLGSLKNGQDAIIDDGVAKLPDFSAFAGSVCTADRCIHTMYKLAGVPLIDAVQMITANPARIIGVNKHKGILAPGMDADICIFDDNITIKTVMVNGKVTVSK